MRLGLWTGCLRHPLNCEALILKQKWTQGEPIRTPAHLWRGDLSNPTAHENIPNQSTERPLTFLWLEITGLCNLSCAHCYAGSSPVGSRGEMKTEDWYTIIQDAADMGCKSIQFIGGEPTTHPDLNRLIRLARELEMRIEVYTNLVSVKDEHWKTFQEYGVNIATSFYPSRA